MQPCPFCGSPAYAGKHKYYEGKFIVRCGGGSHGLCSFFPSSGPIEEKDLGVYIKEWNSRCYVSR